MIGSSARADPAASAALIGGDTTGTSLLASGSADGSAGEARLEVSFAIEEGLAALLAEGDRAAEGAEGAVA